MPVEVTAEAVELAENAKIQLGETTDATNEAYKLNAYAVDSTMMLYLNITDKYQSSNSTVTLTLKYNDNVIAKQTVNFKFIKPVDGMNPYTVRIKGTLEKLVSEEAEDSITTITLGGRLCGLDIAYLKDSLKLKVLDMSQADIVTGSGTYYGDYTTEDNIVGVRMFAGMDVQTIILPNTATEIGNYAFYQNDKLTKAVIGENTTKIGNYAFSGCTALERMTIPANVTEIGRNAFKNCPIVCMICESETPPTLSSKVFDGADLDNATLVVPNEAAIETYKAAKQWKDFGNIITYDQYLTKIDDVEIEEENGVYVKNGNIIVTQDKEVAIYNFAGKLIESGYAGQYNLPK